MAAATTQPPQPPDERETRLVLGSRVRSREAGETGRVVGFYVTETPTVLVRLDTGVERQFFPHALQHAS